MIFRKTDFITVYSFPYIQNKFKLYVCVAGASKRWGRVFFEIV